MKDATNHNQSKSTPEQDFVLYGTAKKLSKEPHKINVSINGERR
jgi:hypothetical protein